MPHRIVNLLFTITHQNIKLTVLWGMDFLKIIREYIVSDKFGNIRWCIRGTALREWWREKPDNHALVLLERCLRYADHLGFQCFEFIINVSREIHDGPTRTNLSSEPSTTCRAWH